MDTEAPRKIVSIISTSFPNKKNTISGVFVARLVESLKDIVDVHVVTPSYSGQQKYTYNGVNVYPYRYAPSAWEIVAHGSGGIPVALKNNKFLYLVIPFFLAALLGAVLRYSRKADIIHANWAICGAIAGIASIILRKPLVTTLRGEDITRAEKNCMDKFILSIAVRLSKRVVAVSDAIGEKLVGAFPEAKEKVRVIYNGTGTEFVDVGRGRQYPEKKQLELVTVASLIPRKGIDQVVRAMALVNDTLDLRFNIVGEGPERKSLEELVERMGLRGKVEFTGPKPHDEIPQLMKKADIFVLASHSEGRANVLLEAMASGLPIIASDIEGTRELIGRNNTGLLFTLEDIAELAEKITCLGESSQRELLGSSACKFITSSGLTWAGTAQKYNEEYESILNN